jgi:hypothetical protein
MIMEVVVVVVVVVVLMEVDAGTDTLQSATKNAKWQQLPE